MPRMSYEFSHKLFGTKQVPIESVCNSEHFDMHLMAELLMVPEILVPQFQWLWHFLIKKTLKNIDFWNQYLGNHKQFSLEMHIKMLRIARSFDWFKFCSKKFMGKSYRTFAYGQVALAFSQFFIILFFLVNNLI